MYKIKSRARRTVAESEATRSRESRTSSRTESNKQKCKTGRCGVQCGGCGEVGSTGMAGMRCLEYGGLGVAGCVVVDVGEVLVPPGAQSLAQSEPSSSGQSLLEVLQRRLERAHHSQLQQAEVPTPDRASECSSVRVWVDRGRACYSRYTSVSSARRVARRPKRPMCPVGPESSRGSYDTSR